MYTHYVLIQVTEGRHRPSHWSLLFDLPQWQTQWKPLRNMKQCQLTFTGEQGPARFLWASKPQNREVCLWCPQDNNETIEEHLKNMVLVSITCLKGLIFPIAPGIGKWSDICWELKMSRTEFIRARVTLQTLIVNQMLIIQQKSPFNILGDILKTFLINEAYSRESFKIITHNNNNNNNKYIKICF